MAITTLFRTVKRLNSVGCWEDIEFKDIKAGDRVRLYEIDGMLVCDCRVRTDAAPAKGARGNMDFESGHFYYMGIRPGPVIEPKCDSCGRVPIFDTVRECMTPGCSNDVCCHCESIGICNACAGGVDPGREYRELAEDLKVEVDPETNSAEVEGVDFSQLGMKKKPLWVAGQVRSENLSAALTHTNWELQGVFDTKEKAIAACHGPAYFVGTINMNEEAPAETQPFPAGEYPAVSVEVDNVKMSGGPPEQGQAKVFVHVRLAGADYKTFKEATAEQAFEVIDLITEKLETRGRPNTPQSQVEPPTCNNYQQEQKKGESHDT